MYSLNHACSFVVTEERIFNYIIKNTNTFSTWKIILTYRRSKCLLTTNKMAGEASIVKQKIDEDLLREHEEHLEAISDEDTEGENIEETCTKVDKNCDLHFAAAFGSMDNLKQELALPNTKIDAENFMGWTPLMMAIRNGHIEAVKLLLENGADITRKNKLGVNCFNLSIANGDIELVDIVLRHMLSGGISRNRIQENLSPISLAIVLKKNHLLRFLMTQGFDLNTTTWKTELTPLMFAAAVNAEKVMSLLETKGANVNAKNCMGVNYQDIIKWRKQGLERLRQGEPSANKPQFNLPNIVINPEQPINSVPTFPLIQMVNPSYSKENLKVFVPQEVVAVPQSDNMAEMNDENDMNRMNKPGGSVQSPKICVPKSSASKKDTNPLPLGKDSPFTQQSSQFDSPYNGLPCRMYIPINVVGSPFLHSPVTPLMAPPSYQNFMASVGELAQNTPSPMHSFQPGTQVFFASPLARPDINCTFDPNAINPNIFSYPGSPMFYSVFPNVQNVYNPPTAEH